MARVDQHDLRLHARGERWGRSGRRESGAPGLPRLPPAVLRAATRRRADACCLRLEDAKSAPLAEDDDGGGFPSARIVFTANRTENYRIIVTSFGGQTGPYTLTVHEQ